MSIVTLVSGGLDSTLMTKLADESNLIIYPLFINYGQRAYKQELQACLSTFEFLNLPEPKIAEIPGLGKLIPCGLTREDLDVNDAAFMPGRNLYFILLAASYAYQLGANSVAIGLLDEQFSIFPDQTVSFINKAEKIICEILGKKISILTPLMSFSKQEVVNLANEKGIIGTYSCHVGSDKPCGICIACREYDFQEVS